MGGDAAGRDDGHRLPTVARLVPRRASVSDGASPGTPDAAAQAKAV